MTKDPNAAVYGGMSLWLGLVWQSAAGANQKDLFSNHNKPELKQKKRSGGFQVMKHL
jgi:hypothetical protein